MSRTTNLFAHYPAWKRENYYFLWGLSFVPPKSHPFFSHSLSSHYNESFVNNSLFFRVSLRLSNALLDLARLWQNGIMLYVLFCHLSSFGVNLWVIYVDMYTYGLFIYVYWSPGMSIPKLSNLLFVDFSSFSFSSHKQHCHKHFCNTSHSSEKVMAI